jgi:hypothetical protein
MECAKRGCRRKAIAGSNYCREHKPGGPSRRKLTKMKAAKKKR